MQYGRVCPQGPRGSWDEDEESWLFCYDDGKPGEDCLRLNIWTPGIKVAGNGRSWYGYMVEASFPARARSILPMTENV